MNKNLRRYTKNGHRRAFLRRILSIFSCMVVFVTTYALILPAITMEKTALCGLEEHQHDEDCFEKYPVCGLEESDGHVHSDDCYESVISLICGKKEHDHSDGCFDKEGNLTCALEEHSHLDECQRVDRILACPEVESEGHRHTTGCFEKTLICGKEPHTHSEGCYAEDDSTDSLEAADGAVDAEDLEAAVEDDSTDSLEAADGAVDAENTEAAVDEPVSGESVPDQSVSDGMDDGTFLEETAIEETAIEETAIEETAIEESAIEESAIEETVIEESDTEGFVSEGTDDGLAVEGFFAKESVSEEYVAEETASDESAAEESMPDESSTEGSAPEVSAAEDSGSDRSAAEESAPAGSAAEEPGSDGSAAEEPGSNGSAVEGSAPEVSAAEDSGSDGSAAEESAPAGSAAEEPGSDGSAAEEPGSDGSESAGSEASGAEEALQPVQAAEISSVPLEQAFTEKTGIYYRAGESDPGDGSSWKRVTDSADGQTELVSTDVVRLYYAYTIPAGTLDGAGAQSRISLPSNVRLTSEQIETVNSQYDGRGGQAIEGIRTPDAAPEEAEYVSAWITVENVYDEAGETVLSQDVLLTFDPYTIDKNRDIYDTEGNPASEGKDVSGFFSIDVLPGQIDFVEVPDQKVPELRPEEPEAAKTETAELEKRQEVPESETAEPETSEIETAEPETTGPDTAEPETTKSDTTEPETAEPETAAPGTMESEKTESETTKPDTAESETTKPDTAELETTRLDTAEPETTKPDTTEPETADSETAAPEKDQDSLESVSSPVQNIRKKYQAEVVLVEEDETLGIQEIKVPLLIVTEEPAGRNEAETGLEHDDPNLRDSEKERQNREVRDQEGPEQSGKKQERENQERKGQSETDGKVPDAENAEDQKADGEKEEGEGGSDTQKVGKNVFFQGVADTLTFEGPDYTVTASYTEEAGIPEGASLVVSEITADAEEYRSYCEQAEAAVENSDKEEVTAWAESSAEDKTIAEEKTSDEEKSSGEQLSSAEKKPSTEAGTDAEQAALAEQTASPEQTMPAEQSASTEPTSSAGQKVSWIRLFDISIEKDGVPVEPQAPVSVQITYREAIENEGTTEVSTVHFEGGEETPKVLETKSEVNGNATEQVSFETDGFSIFAIVGMTIEKVVLASDGHNYRISVTCGPDAGVPAGAELKVEEILEGTDAADGAAEYETYLEMTREALGLESGVFAYARFFDIRIVDENGEKVEITAPVDVKIELADKESGEEDENTRVVHFADGSAAGDVVEITGISRGMPEEGGMEISFEAAGFSVYAIVDAPEPAVPEIRTVASLTELAENTSAAFYLSYGTTPMYFTNSLNSDGCFIEKSNHESASEWYFEPAENGYYLCTFIDGVKYYVRNTSGNRVGLTTARTDGTVFALTETEGQTFYFKHAGAEKWLQHSGSGKGIRFWTDNDNAANSRITITYVSSFSVDNDPYDLDGKQFGIAFHNGDISAISMTTAPMSEGKRLGFEEMVVRPDILEDDDLLLVSVDSDITEWTFRNIAEDQYYLTAKVGGVDKYLTINGGVVTLEDSPASGDQSVVRVVPGTGSNAGKYSFIGAGGYRLNADNAANSTGGEQCKGFNAVTKDTSTTWMNLVVKHEKLGDDDFTPYYAHKVSVSDNEKVYDRQTVVIYTRVWNEEKKRYDFYVVNSDGTLLRCYESGDTIDWVGNKEENQYWTFTEHSSNGQPTYYYELRNTNTGLYLAPNLTEGSLFSTGESFMNMTGRRLGRDYTTMVAWVNEDYAYTGLKVENGRVVPCPLEEAEDFYFAIVDDEQHTPADELTTVSTVDSTLYGITMKMVDFDNEIRTKNGTLSPASGRDVEQTRLLGYDTNDAGLLSTDLTEGYPITVPAVTGTEESYSLSELFKQEQMKDVNHLFLESTYKESGYFEYDSTQNFAHLNEDGTFTVYNQLGAIGNDTRKTRTHGQFMPYNALIPGQYSEATNQTDVEGNQLSDLNPRKNEKLYLIQDQKTNEENYRDYFFGMEMEARFTQTASGLDAWGHDIIFEFSGDDDFWLYVDDELVLDLGGVHSASIGTVNFRTGEVVMTVRDAKGKLVNDRCRTTSLYEIFKQNYISRGMQETEYLAKLEELFEMKDGNYVFKDYSSHTMKVFYMERGAGASNLHMRFNLASVKPGTVELVKTLSGNVSDEYAYAEFPFQIWYRTNPEENADYVRLAETDVQGARNVRYTDKNTVVKYAESFTPVGCTESNESVFFIRPGEKVEIHLPEGTVDYYIVECGIDPLVYDVVQANGSVLTGIPTSDGKRESYGTSAATMEERPTVAYDNHVKDDAVRRLNITKKLYDESGTNELIDDTATFDLRLSLGTENDVTPPRANMASYHVRDPHGNYCRWDSATGKFVSLEINDFAVLTAEQKRAATFTTSINGAISKIPPFYTVEVPELIAGTRFLVEELKEEIPDGYSFREYKRADSYYNAYQQEGTETLNSGIIRTRNTEEERDSEVEVHNLKGWGLRVNKAWSDKTFMASHDPIYFAVYLADINDPTDESKLALILDTVRRITNADELTAYWYFDRLQPGTFFSQYLIREVTITNPEPTLNEDGIVTDPGTVTPIEPGGTLTVGAVLPGESDSELYGYLVTYETGEQETGGNVRVDTVTNSRDGLRIVKNSLNGNPLAGASFTLEKIVDGGIVPYGAGTYTSDETGQVTIAYLPDGTYTLTESGAPTGYQGLAHPIQIVVSGQSYTVTGNSEDNDLFAYSTNGSSSALEQDEMPTITIKNRPFTLRAVKKGPDGSPLEGVTFALHRQVRTVDGVGPAYDPINEYASLATDAQGIIPKINERLPETTYPPETFTYYLREKGTKEGYALISEDLCFTISKAGFVTIAENSHWTLDRAVDENGTVNYTIIITNDYSSVPVRIIKTDQLKKPLEGAGFTISGNGIPETSCTSRITTVHIGDEDVEEAVIYAASLQAGSYTLTETNPPDGYNALEGPVKIEVINQGTGIIVSATINGQDSAFAKAERVDVNHPEYGWVVRVMNSAGYELPSTGGAGTGFFSLTGLLLTCFAAWGFAMRKRN